LFSGVFGGFEKQHPAQFLEKVLKAKHKNFLRFGPGVVDNLLLPVLGSNKNFQQKKRFHPCQN